MCFIFVKYVLVLLNIFYFCYICKTFLSLCKYCVPLYFKVLLFRTK